MTDKSELGLFRFMPMVETAKQELLECNAISQRYGLSLSEEDAVQLAESRMRALKASGRIEFSGGILPKLIYAFCDSQYIQQSSYESTLEELQDAFYYYKNEAGNSISDDELIEFMANVFNGRAQGSVDFLVNISLDALCRYAINDYDPFVLEEYEEGDLL